MPRDETADDASVYRRLKGVDDLQDEIWPAVNDAARYRFSDRNPSHLSPAQVDEEIDRTQIALAKCIMIGVALENISVLSPDFPPSATNDELNRLINSPDKPTQDRLAAARADRRTPEGGRKRAHEVDARRLGAHQSIRTQEIAPADAKK
jgi:hypothetical protein